MPRSAPIIRCQTLARDTGSCRAGISASALGFGKVVRGGGLGGLVRACCDICIGSAVLIVMSTGSLLDGGVQ